MIDRRATMNTSSNMSCNIIDVRANINSNDVM